MAGLEGENNMLSPEKERFAVRRMVVKIGGSTITKDGNPLNEVFMGGIARQVAELMNSGVQVVIVSSGAISSGRAIYERPGMVFDDSTKEKKVLNDRIVATCGQIELSIAWKKAFEEQHLIAHQLMLTDRDLDSAKDVIKGIQAIGGVPIINGHDAVSEFETRQFSFSADNDRLAGRIATLIGADSLLFLTDRNGVVDLTGTTIPYVDKSVNIKKFIKEFITEDGSGTGGMESKVVVAKAAAEQSKRAIIADGYEEDVILKAAKGIDVGTRFVYEESTSQLEQVAQTPFIRKGRKHEISQLVDDLKTVTIDTPDEVLQMLLSQVNSSVYASRRRVINESLIAVTHLVRGLGYYIRPAFTHTVVAKFIRAGIIIGPFNYGFNYRYFTHRSRIPLAAIVLFNDSDMQKYLENSVQQLCGESIDVLPTTINLLKSKSYKPFNRLLRELGIYVWGDPFDAGKWLRGCPVNIFSMRDYTYKDKTYRTSFYPVDSEEHLKEFLKDKIKGYGELKGLKL